MSKQSVQHNVVWMNLRNTATNEAVDRDTEYAWSAGGRRAWVVASCSTLSQAHGR